MHCLKVDTSYRQWFPSEKTLKMFVGKVCLIKIIEYTKEREGVQNRSIKDQTFSINIFYLQK